jgi:hypothetical protein
MTDLDKIKKIERIENSVGNGTFNLAGGLFPPISDTCLIPRIKALFDFNNIRSEVGSRRRDRVLNI